MAIKNKYDVIIIGGSYAGLAAAMALGRALRNVLIIDSGTPCNRQTPQSHNFLTQDGIPPHKIAAIAKQQVLTYHTVSFENDTAVQGIKKANGFEIQTKAGRAFFADKIIFASGISDIMPAIEGFAECWGISVLHCPYCHGYEVRDLPTGILANGDAGFEMAKLIYNWTKDLVVFTNGIASFTKEQIDILNSKRIKIEERSILKIEHTKGLIENIVFKDGARASIKALYARLPFVQHSDIPAQLGCTITEEGYINADTMQKTNIHGVFVCGDNCSRIRTVANAVSSGTTAAIMLNKELIDESFNASFDKTK